MKEPSKKVIKQIMVDYPNSEIFLEHEFMEDIPSKFFIPEHCFTSAILSCNGSSFATIIENNDITIFDSSIKETTIFTKRYIRVNI